MQILRKEPWGYLLVLTTGTQREDQFLSHLCYSEATVAHKHRLHIVLSKEPSIGVLNLGKSLAGKAYNRTQNEWFGHGKVPVLPSLRGSVKVCVLGQGLERKENFIGFLYLSLT